MLLQCCCQMVLENVTMTETPCLQIIVQLGILSHLQAGRVQLLSNTFCRVDLFCQTVTVQQKYYNMYVNTIFKVMCYFFKVPSNVFFRQRSIVQHLRSIQCRNWRFTLALKKLSMKDSSTKPFANQSPRV